MYTVQRLRKAIDFAMYELEPEEGFAGPEEAVRTLWTPAGEEWRIADSAGLASETAHSGEDDLGTATALETEDLLEFWVDLDEDKIREAMGGTGGDLIRRSVEARGVDGLAWYVTFHIRGAQWGIYIPLSSVAYLAVEVFGDLDADLGRRLRLAFRILHQHELFHFAVDYMVGRLEVLTGLASHREATRALKADLGYFKFGELAANAFMIRSLANAPLAIRNIRGKMDALRRFVLLQPEGYCDALDYVEKKRFLEVCGLLGMYYAEYPLATSPLDGRSEAGLEYLLPMWPRIDWRYCPVHCLHDERRVAIPTIMLDLFSCIPSIEEPDRFRKMLRQLPEQIQRSWQKAKSLLANTTSAKGIDFKPWHHEGRDVYSIRLSDNYRAHIAYMRSTGTWSALEVGTHKKMGHG